MRCVLAPEFRPRPVTLGESFGWFHPAQGGRTPVLLCPPLGVEALASHIGWRGLAARLAAQGHEVLRLDYPGTGHAPGETLAPARLAHWQASIGSAMEALKAATGAHQVLVIGMRLGASLAAHAVQGRADLAGLVMLAPLTSGRRYAREIAALSRMQGESGHSPAGIALHGFEIAQETLEALGGLDLAALPAPAAGGLVFARTPGEAALASQWGFEHAPFEGFEAFTENPTHGRVPEAVFTQVLAWCSARPAAPRTATPKTTTLNPLPPARFDLPGGLVEEAVLFGPDESLFGMMSRPAQACSPLGVIITNAGRNPASGWGRQGVELARALARAGHAALLFDGNGIGDSERAPDSPEEVLYSTRQEDDILSAMALMRARGATGVFIIGACSGAFSALHAVQRAEGLVGLTLINLLRFHWQPGESLDVVTAQNNFRPTQAYGRRVFHLDTWKRMLRGDIALAPIAATLARRGLGALKRPVVRMLARCGLAHSREIEALGWFRALDAQQVRVLMIHSPEDPGLVELAAYFGPEGHRLAALRHTTLHSIDGGDHSFSRVSGREDLRRLLVAETERAAQVLSGSGKTAPRQ
jgi:pimeloyl-ACP methyl ester carboxylesterase